MIETFYGRGTLDSPQALVAALFVGLAFGFALERAGFGSSRRLAGIFYFRDMAVLKVMFTALVVAMLGLLYLMGMGWLGQEQLYFMPSIYGAQIVAGLIFGVGFVMGGWCPGTAAVGLASGKADAAVFLGGAVLGSVLFNEVYTAVGPLYHWGDRGVQFAWAGLGLGQGVFAMLFTVAAVLCFWGAEWIEKRTVNGGPYFKTPFLKAFSVALVVLAAGLLLLGPVPAESAVALPPPAAAQQPAAEQMLLAAIASGEDHIEPEELADRLVERDPSLFLVDVRTPAEFQAFHLPGAVNVALPDLPTVLAPRKDQGIIVLYSNGMTHPAQARDALARLGYRNVYLLSDGLEGFIRRCLKPVSLRTEPLPASAAARINAWRQFVYGDPPAAAPAAGAANRVASSDHLPGLVDTTWLAAQLGRRGLVIVDCRAQPQYNGGHIPGSVCMSPENVRGVVEGVSAMLMPGAVLAAQMSAMGLDPEDTVVVVPADKLHDATLIGMAFERLGHRRWAVLDGGYTRWAAENRPVDTLLPAVARSTYPLDPVADRFTVDYRTVLRHVQRADAIILDVRPADYYAGAKSDEARPGHIPGALNRPFSEDVAAAADSAGSFRPLDELAAAYAKLLPAKDARIVVHCRTGHQASQTFFVLRHLLGYANVFWYDGGWSEWASRPELPVEATKAD